MELDVVDVQILLELMSRKGEDRRPNKIAETLQIRDYEFSRKLRILRDAGLVDRENQRCPKLTSIGNEAANKYYIRVFYLQKILERCGLPPETAHVNALTMSVSCTDEMFVMVDDMIEVMRIKELVINKRRFAGTWLEKEMQAGRYPLELTLYRLENSSAAYDDSPVLNEKNIYSMANDGFEHPATLVVGENEAYVLLTVREKEERSLSTKKLMRGRLKKLEYQVGKTFTEAFKGAPEVRLPLSAFKFNTIGGSDISKARLHGTLKLKVECTVGPTHMPPSICMLEVIL